jgi:DNA mismatch repair protein MutL
VRGILQARGRGDAGGVVVAADLPRARSGFPDLPRDLFGRAAEPVPFAARTTAPPATPVVREDAATAPAPRPNPFARVSGRFLQVLDLYLLLEGPDGLLVVDQHALHERVVYERLRREHAARAVQLQRLLVPAVVAVTPTELAWLEEARAGLAEQGLLVEAFGPAAVAVHGLPAVLASIDPQRLVRDLLAAGNEDGRTAVQDRIAERFHSVACRSAVMSGDRLGEAEIAALLQAAATLEHPHNCPHGRPTVLTFGAAELERYFRRRC